MKFWLNGEFKDNTNAIDIADRGFLLGDGVFETLLLVGGRPAFLAAHLDRMRGGAAALGIDVQIADAELKAAINELARRNGTVQEMGVCRITLTRGAGLRGLACDESSVPSTLLITVSRFAPPEQTAPLKLMVSRHRRCQESLTARWKTLNYLDNVLARREAGEAGADDAVMLNGAGRVACATAANIFVVRDKIIRTPPVEEGALAGVMRGVLIASARTAGIDVRQAPIEPGELSRSSLFVTNSLIGLRMASVTGAGGGMVADREVIVSLKSCYEQALTIDLASRKAAH